MLGAQRLKFNEINVLNFLDLHLSSPLQTPRIITLAPPRGRPSSWRPDGRCGAVEREASVGRCRGAHRAGRRNVGVLRRGFGRSGPHDGPRGRKTKRTRRGLKSLARSGGFADLPPAILQVRMGPPSERVKNPRSEGSRPPTARSAPAQAETVLHTLHIRAWPGALRRLPSLSGFPTEGRRRASTIQDLKGGSGRNGGVERSDGRRRSHEHPPRPIGPSAPAFPMLRP